MKYTKPIVEIVMFDPGCAFMTTSPGCPTNYSSAQDALEHECQGFSGNTNSFTCDVFGGYSGHAPKDAQVVIAGVTYTYVFETHGNSGRWYCSSNNS